jgi:quinol-cytochrome oxidoreductase complex cytochrome b subunit
MDLIKMAEKRADAKIEFQENLYKYLIVNVIIAIVCLLFLKSFWLLFITMFFGGLGVLDKFFKAYSIKNHREKMIEKELSKMGE